MTLHFILPPSSFSLSSHPYPLLFATISGAHLYGFPSPDSDYDLRGAHALPLDAIAGLEMRDETVQQEMIVKPHPGPSSGPMEQNRRLPPAEASSSFAETCVRSS